MNDTASLFAEDAPYWGTTVSPAKSQSEIQEMLEAFGIKKMFVLQGEAGNKVAWLIRFEYQGRSYRFAFVPLDCKAPDRLYTFSGKRRTASEQARYQMGRTAAWFVKALLTAARATPAALFGFMELPGVKEDSGLPAIASELDVSEIVASLPDVRLNSGSSYLALASGE